MLGVESIPGVIVLPGMRRIRKPPQSADRNNGGAETGEGLRLSGVPPINIKQRPGWRDAGQMRDQQMHLVSAVRRIGYDSFGAVEVGAQQCVLSLGDVVRVDALKAVGFDLPRQCAVTVTRLREGGKFFSALRNGINGFTALGGVG